MNHGAGRRMSRGEAMRQLDQQKVDEQYRRDDILVNTRRPRPARRVGPVLQELARRWSRPSWRAGLARVEHTLWPVASIKGNEERAAKDRQRERKGHDRSREKERDAERERRPPNKGTFLSDQSLSFVSTTLSNVVAP